jgi:hypothetical protein
LTSRFSGTSIVRLITAVFIKQVYHKYGKMQGEYMNPDYIIADYMGRGRF